MTHSLKRSALPPIAGSRAGWSSAAVLVSVAVWRMTARFRRLGERGLPLTETRGPQRHLPNIHFPHLPHPHLERRRKEGAPLIASEHVGFNGRVAVFITKAVGSMWCAYAFAALALVSLPDAIHQGTVAMVSWVSQTFLQLVLLSVIMVGQQVLAKASDKQTLQTFRDAEAILELTDKIHHLTEVNNKLTDEIHHLITGGAPRLTTTSSPS